MDRIFFCILPLIFVTLTSASQAAEKPNTNEKAKSTQELAGVAWTFHGDAYYMYNTNTPTNQNDGTAGYGQNGYRAYDVAHNSFELSDVGFTLNKKLKDFSLFAQFDFGTQPDLIYGVADGRNISQAYISIHSPQLQNWIIEIGKFNSHMGYESILAKDNWNYSRSMAHLYGTPNWHMGARAKAPTLENLNLTFFVLNGEGTTDMKDNNKSKTLGAQVKFTPSYNLTLTYNTVWGPEKENNDSDYTMIHNLIGEIEVYPTFKLAGEIVYGQESNDHAPGDTVSDDKSKSKWTSVAVYGYLTLTETFYFSPRFEYFTAEEADGMLGMVNAGTSKDETVNTFTFTFGQKIGDGLDMRYELRRDASDFDEAFAQDGGVGNDNRTDEQITAAVALLFQI